MCVSCTGPLYTQININKLERECSARPLDSYNWCTSPSALLKSSQLESLQLRRYWDRLKLMHLLYHNKSAPILRNV